MYVWNNLPEIVISEDTTDTFKRNFGKPGWDKLYDNKVELTGVGSRSVVNADDNCKIIALLHFLFFVCAI